VLHTSIEVVQAHAKIGEKTRGRLSYTVDLSDPLRKLYDLSSDRIGRKKAAGSCGARR
jgi:hypothetical protein